MGILELCCIWYDFISSLKKETLIELKIVRPSPFNEYYRNTQAYGSQNYNGSVTLAF